MHMFAKHIGEVVKEHYRPEEMMCSPTGHEELKELGEWVDIMKDLASFDRDIRIIEAMDDAEKDGDMPMDTEDIVAKIKKVYSHTDAAKKATMKAELTKMIQTM